MYIEDKFKLGMSPIDNAIKIDEYTNRSLLNYYSNSIAASVLSELKYNTNELEKEPFLISIDFEKCIDVESETVVTKCFIRSVRDGLSSDITNIMRLLLSTAKTDIEMFLKLLPFNSELDCVLYKTVYDNPMMPVRKISGMANTFDYLMSYWINTLLDYITMIHKEHLLNNELHLSFKIFTNYTDSTGGSYPELAESPYILSNINIEDIKNWCKLGWGSNGNVSITPTFGLTKEQVNRSFKYHTDVMESFSSVKELVGVKILNKKTRDKK